MFVVLVVSAACNAQDGRAPVVGSCRKLQSCVLDLHSFRDRL
jgi:hypothetical protein